MEHVPSLYFEVPRAQRFGDGGTTQTKIRSQANRREDFSDLLKVLLSKNMVFGETLT